MLYVSLLRVTKCNKKKMPRKNTLESHVKLLKLNGVDISTLTNENVRATLDSMRLGPTKQQPLSANYKVSILNSIREINSNVTLKPKQLKVKRNRVDTKISNELFSKILLICNYAFNYNPESTIAPVTLGQIDTLIAIMLIVSTNIKIRELNQILPSITMVNFKELVTTSKTIVEINNGPNTIPILGIPQLMRTLQNQVELLILYRDSNFQRRNLARAAKIAGQLITCTSDVLNKKIKELSILLTNPINNDTINTYAFMQTEPTTSLKSPTSKSLGLRVIMKIPRDILVESLTLPEIETPES